jgi:hypothetical protein
VITIQKVISTINAIARIINLAISLKNDPLLKEEKEATNATTMIRIYGKNMGIIHLQG